MFIEVLGHCEGHSFVLNETDLRSLVENKFLGRFDLFLICLLFKSLFELGSNIFVLMHGQRPELVHRVAMGLLIRRHDAVLGQRLFL